MLAYFDVQSRFFFGYALKHMPLASLVLMLASAPRTLPGGFAGIADQLLSVVQRQGAWYHGEPFPELQIRANRITGISMSREHIDARNVILNVPGDHAESVLLLDIREEVVPVGMLPVALCIAKAEYAGDYYSLFLSKNGNLTASPSGRRSLVAVFPPAHAHDQPVDSFMSTVSTVIPFLHDFKIHSSMLSPYARRFTLPPSVTMKPAETRPGRSMIVHCSVKNMTIIPDSVRGILPALFTARTLAAKLN